MINLDVIYSPAVNFAMQQNHVPVIRKILLVNDEDEIIEDIKIKVSISPEISDEFEKYLDLIPPKSTIEIKDFNLDISPNFLSELTEKICGDIQISIYNGEILILTQKYPLDILPFNQWAGVSVLPEMISAFVTPNYPSISAIIHRASHFLEKWTGNPSLNEYQSRNPDRVKKQMAAIYEAIAELNIVYCTPPASYESTGQRIRMCDTILPAKIGTCIDMALLYASCLEAVGINPLIVIIRGHAFAGAWMINDTFSDSVNDDISLLTKRIAKGINEIVVVEATCMNAGNNVDFDLAVSAAEDHLNDSSRFVLFVDIKRCRFASLRPLPLRIADNDGIKIIESPSAVRDNNSPESISVDSRVINNNRIEVTKQRLWERKLLDLSLRNNLLNIRLTKSTLQLISININLLEDALADGHEFAVLPKPVDWDNDMMDAGIYQAINQTDPILDLVKQELTQKRLRSYLSENELSQSLTGLYRGSRSSMEENGANTLFLALGLLKWYETPSSERPRYAPILLLPVEIVRKSAAKGYVIRSREEEVMMNITLLEMLRQDFRMNIGGLEILPKDDSGVDVKLVFNTIRKGIMDQRRWNVEEQAILGIFSFSKFIMWNDIHNNADKLCKNKIVKSLISGIIEWEPGEEVDFNLDKDFKPADIALPISADSFQMEAVCNARTGNSFILHGPPGTGKSQTITNIIADALYSGKKVLFVAEKMAALSVVQKRLSEIGIAPFCLELHSNKSKKSAVLEQLKATTEVLKKSSPENYSFESERLHKIREELRDYVEILHEKLPSGISLYDALYYYYNVSDISSEFEFPSSVVPEISSSKLSEWKDIVEQMQILSDLYGSVSKHPLKEITLSSFSQTVKLELFDILGKQIELSHQLESRTNEVIRLLGDEYKCNALNSYVLLAEMAEVLFNIKHFASSLLKLQNFENEISQLREVISHGFERDRIKSELTANFSKSVLDIDADRILVNWNIAQNKWFLTRFFSQNKIGRDLRVYSLNGKILKNNVVHILSLVVKYQQEKDLINTKTGFYSNTFGSGWEKWDLMEACCNNAILVREKIMQLTGDISKGLVTCECLAFNLSNGLSTFKSLNDNKLIEFIETFKALREVNESISSKYGLTFVNDNWIEDNLALTERLYENIDLLKDWCNWNNLKNKASEIGLNQFVYYISLNDISKLSGALDKALFKAIINYSIETHSILASFNGKLFEEKIRKFKELTSSFEKITREELFTKLASDIPSFVREASLSSEVGILQRNIRNNGRGMSIRKLFDTIPTLLLRINPCMLMSPMSVAQYIDADNLQFDLVIFDEASQMPTCEAVGAIARGKSLIVVGDPKQMPPTNFFSTNTIDEENLDKEDLESILDDCLALSMPSKHLLWHYRSKHESLIAFSNSQYYDNNLLTFPSPDDIKSKVTYHHIEGYYDKGKSRQNKAEADAIVSEILIRLANPELSKLSIGVVTFSSVQQTLIEDLLNEAFIRNPKLEAIALESAEPLFIKNLENVQGDERDVILFSVGYGPDKEGRVSLNFGPLNREGGWRRLNVAVSRARYEMKVFSTLSSDQIDLARTTAEGVAGLKAFLEYAEKGKNVVAVSSQNIKSKSKSLLDVIANRIKEFGYQVNTNIGCSGYRVDIGVVNPENKSEYILGILCDGANYKAAKTVRDREVIQIDVLKLLGWRIHRVWTMDWLENEAKVIDDIVEAIENAPESQEKDIVKTVEPSIESCQVIANEYISNDRFEGVKSYLANYNVTPLEYSGVLAEEFTLPNWEGLIMKQILEVLECEAPISRDQLCKRVLSMWGISRIGSRIDIHFRRIFSRMNLKSTGDGIIRYFWREDQNPENYLNYRPFMTNAADISPEEISVAVKEVLEAQISLSLDDLIRETAKLFGFTRLGNIVEPAMRRGIEKAIQRGFAKEEGGRAIVN